MSTRLSTTRLNALFAAIAIAAVTILLAQGFIHHSIAQAQQAPPQQRQVVNQWEYKTFYIGHKSEEKLNKEISEPQWEFIGATDEWAIFRRPVRVIR